VGKYGNWKSYSLLEYILQNGTSMTFTSTLPALQQHMKDDPTDNRLVEMLVAFDYFRATVDNQTFPDSFKITFKGQSGILNSITFNSTDVCNETWHSDGLCWFGFEIEGWSLDKTSRQEAITINPTSGLPFDSIISVGYFAPDLSPDTPSIYNYYLSQKTNDANGYVATFTSAIAGLLNLLVTTAYWIIKIGLLVFAVMLPLWLMVKIWKLISQKMEAM
jgi:hypothetical protein